MGYISHNAIDAILAGGTADLDHEVHVYAPAPGEGAENGIASCREGAVILTNLACYLLRANGGVEVVWRTPYDSVGAKDSREGAATTGGGLAWGGGCSPSLSKELVFFTDNLETVSLMAVDIRTGEVAASHPIIDELPSNMPVSVENSAIVYDHGNGRVSTIVCNWFGAGSPNLAKPDSDSSIQSYENIYDRNWLLKGNCMIMPGVERVDTIRTADGWTNYSCFSLWDTYRTLNPLLTILSPSMVNDIVRSFLSIYDEQGKLPIWTLVGGETNCMPGYSSVPIIADAYMKGIRGYDAGKALDAMVATATNPAQNGVPYLLEKGYIPCDKVHEATSIALEYAADDWGTALMAKEMGRTDLYEEYMRRGHAYETYFDRTLNYIRPKMDDGSWRTPYDPFKSVHSVGDFTEGTGWQYTFFVPQHPEGLIALMGGDDAFVTKLDSLFSVEGDMGAEASSDISGLIGQYAHGNEPSHHVIYLFNSIGFNDRTQYYVAKVMNELYKNEPAGLCGNEDCGQMSAWYVFSAMGFYPVNPVSGRYEIGTPLFPEIKLHLANGKTFTVLAPNVNKENIYIQSIKVDGQPYDKTYLTHEQIMSGATVEFEMSNTPKAIGVIFEEKNP